MNTNATMISSLVRSRKGVPTGGSSLASPPDISVIIVSWNTRALLVDCLNSVFADLRGVPTEVFVVDNASTDDTVFVVSSQFPDVRLVRNAENLGFARANNIALEMCRGRFVCLVNSDIVVQQGCFSALRGYLVDHPTAGVVAPRLLNSDLSLQRSCKSFPTILNNLGPALGLDRLFPHARRLVDADATLFDHDQPAVVDMIAGAFLMVRREALDEVGFLDERFFFYGEDADWCRRFHDRHWQVAFYPAAEAIHREGRSSARSPVRFYIESRRSRLRFWGKHHSAPGVAAITAIILMNECIRIGIFSALLVLAPWTRRTVGYKVVRSFHCVGWLLGLPFQHKVDDKNVKKAGMAVTAAANQHQETG